jgi:hypothetical protein
MAASNPAPTKPIHGRNLILLIELLLGSRTRQARHHSHGNRGRPNFTSSHHYDRAFPSGGKFTLPLANARLIQIMKARAAKALIHDLYGPSSCLQRNAPPSHSLREVTQRLPRLNRLRVFPEYSRAG